MKFYVLIWVLALSACADNDNGATKGHQTGTESPMDTARPRNGPADSLSAVPGPENKPGSIDHTRPGDAQNKNVYANERFKDVTVERISEHQFRIKGKGQIFEAAFSWVVEDGHEELKKGFAMTDAGAPEWGNFNFEVDVQKKRPNSTLHLVLFETSAKDGSRQYELPVLLY
jgi:hypothetical protein